MKPSEVIAILDEMKPNAMSTEMKYRYINEIEHRVHGEVIMKHVHTEEQETCPVYSQPGEGSTEPEMLVPDEYGMLYVYWLKSRVDEMYQEYEKYNNDRTLFEDAWGSYADKYTEDHMPLTARPHFMI